METKADIRKRILKLRDGILPPKQRTKSADIIRQVMEDTEFLRSELLYLYMDYQSEVCTGLLLTESLRMGKRIAVPRVEGTEIEFYEIESENDVEPGYAGIPEPVTRRTVTDGNGYMVVPGTVFSKDRYRIGYGKGFYDRYLKRYPNIYTCGLAFDCQIVEQIPTEEHDVALKKIITESCRITADGMISRFENK